MFEYVRFEGITYHILRDPENATTHLRKWLRHEWLQDLAANPKETWTQEWLDSLDQLRFSLRTINLSEIRLNDNLMNSEDAKGSFKDSLERRALERMEAIERGVSFEPLTVRACDMQLMDGYTRHWVFNEYKIEEVYVYMGERCENP